MKNSFKSLVEDIENVIHSSPAEESEETVAGGGDGISVDDSDNTGDMPSGTVRESFQMELVKELVEKEGLAEEDVVRAIEAYLSEIFGPDRDKAVDDKISKKAKELAAKAKDSTVVDKSKAPADDKKKAKSV